MAAERYEAWVILSAYAALAVAVLAVSAGARWWLRRGAGRDESWTAMEVAYLNGGLRLAGYACIAELHRLGIVRAAASANLIAVRPSAGLPERAPRLLSAVRNALRQPHSWQTLTLDADVRRVGAALGTRLVKRGWILSAARQKRLRLLRIPGLLVVGWCLVWLVILAMDFSAPGHATLVLGLGVIALSLGVATVVVSDVPPATRAGKAVLRRARHDLKDRTDGASLMARVAVFGEPVMWKADPEFAKHAQAESGKLTAHPRFFDKPHDRFYYR
ncbi:TIGR04222 domain-containing membrane protein [Actinoplanes sp. NPDC049668]|uniref:TIGR04222 domain-containing membrane protein n=1 Tax=unclassified Actinoplanes TaxID=2626549 RepID=UPI0033AC3D4A